MTPTLHVLAETDPWQIAVGVFFALIWLVGSALSALSKSQKEKKQREQLGRTPLPVETMPPLAEQPSQPVPYQPEPFRPSPDERRPMPPMLPSPQQQAEQRRQRKAQEQQRKAQGRQKKIENEQRLARARREAEAAAERLRQQFPARGQEAVVDLDRVAQRAPATARPDPRTQATDSSSALRGGLASRPDNALATELRLALRPKNVKYQFVLNELLRPPLALRDDQE